MSTKTGGSSTARAVLTAGFPAYLICKNGLKCKTMINLEMTANNIKDAVLYWRPKVVGCELSFINTLSKVEGGSGESASKFIINIALPDIIVSLELDRDIEGVPTKAVFNELTDLWKKAQNLCNHELLANQSNIYFQQNTAMKNALFAATVQQESTMQLSWAARCKEANYTIEKISIQTQKYKLETAMKHWVSFVKKHNAAQLSRDRMRWRLHAVSNENTDLQAWYHGLFYQEVYRLRGHFWYKHAALACYSQNSYDMVGNQLTPLEEAQLAQVLCSPNTSYSDVVGQMFVVQAILSPDQFALFQQLASRGLEITKYPRQGLPAKKPFRISFVEGQIYFTWVGKFGNQGVSMEEVEDVVGGIQTDVLKGSAKKNLEKQYLSLLCSDRSVDLFFESEEERNTMKSLLIALKDKEFGVLPGVPSMNPEEAILGGGGRREADVVAVASKEEDKAFEWKLLYSSIGKVKEGTATAV